MEYIIPLKSKYQLTPFRWVPAREWEAPTSERRGVPEGTKLYSAGRFKAKTMNAGTKKKGQTLRPRMKSYYGNVLR